MTVKLSQSMTPLYSAMEKYAADGAKAYHTPGHKQGLGIHPQLLKAITPYGLKMEVSLMEELDDIHGATHCIKDAQDLAAQLYGARSTAFFVNGTTGAIHAMLLAAVKAGDEVLIPRNAHSSVLGALILTGAKPVYLQPEIDENLGIATNINPAAVARALQTHPGIRAMVLVHPNYYGIAADIEAIVRLLHSRKIPLLVDEAHGPHLEFHPHLPVSALRARADIVAQSTHKLLGSMTQTSLLHFNSDLIALERFQDMASLVQSTSPNYLLMASLDLARQQMATRGYELWDRIIKLTASLRKKINELPGLYVFGEEILNGAGSYALDPTKITVNFSRLGLTGPEAEHLLRHEYKIQCELSDAANVLFLFSYADDEAKVDYLYRALEDISKKRCLQNIIPAVPLTLPPLPEQVFTPLEAQHRKQRRLPFADSAGAVAGERISFYPPGIPLIYPGERISKELIDYVSRGLQQGANLKGPSDHELKTIRILEE